jgi:hypothetical protein
MARGPNMTRPQVSSSLYHKFADHEKMRHGLFPQDDISERNSTESRRDLRFEGLRPGLRPGVGPAVRPGVRAKTSGRMYSSLGKNGLSCPRP